jgi:hypothetical protein
MEYDTLIPYAGVDYISPYLIDNVTSVFEGLNCVQIRLNIKISDHSSSSQKCGQLDFGFRQKSIFQVCFFGELRSDAEIFF